MPDSIDHYELHETLGAGALGVTRRGRDTRTGAIVALKLIDRSLASDTAAVARLRREARLASELDHPNIARVLDYGEEAGEWFVASEFAEGETLRTRLRREGCLSETEIHGIAVCAAHALNAANAVRAVHRNLTPENIVVSDDGQLHLCDFGLTQAIDAITPTNYAAFIVSPAYAAPELRERRGDIRSDLYSLGAIMFEALSGQTPAASEPATGGRRDATKPPSFPILSKGSRSLASIVQRLMKADPQDRYADPADVLRDLQTVGTLASERAPAAPPPRAIEVAADIPVTSADLTATATATKPAGDAPPVSESAATPGTGERGAGRWGIQLRGRRPRVNEAVLSQQLDDLMEYGRLTQDQEQSFNAAIASLGVENLDRFPAVQQRLVIARANDARLPVVEAGSAGISLRPGELLHLEAPCARVDRASQGLANPGLAFPLVKGVPYRRPVGELRPLGRNVSNAERGVLSITTRRAVFTSQAGIEEESMYARLVFVRIFSDGIGISVSDCQHIGTYRLLDTSGEAVAAVINAAFQKMS